MESIHKYWYLSKSAIEKILQYAPINHPDPHNRPPLLYAIAMARDQDNLTVAEELIKAGAQLDVYLYGKKMTFMHITNSIKIIELLVKSGADVNARSQNGFTPALTHSRYYDILKYLLKKGADFHAVNNAGQGIFHEWINCILLKYDITEDEKNCLELFCSQDCDINLQDKNGNTPLHILIERVMLDMSQKDSSYASQIINQGKEIIKIFTQKGADLSIKNQKGETVPEYYNRLKQEIGELAQ